MHSHAILPAAYNTPVGRNCVLHQISVNLGECYHKLCDAFRTLFQAQYGSEEMDYVTPLLVVEFAKARGHYCYYLKANTLVYRHVFPAKMVESPLDRKHGGSRRNV